MESTAGPSRSEATPEEQPNNQVVIDKANLEELIGNVIRAGDSCRVPPPV